MTSAPARYLDLHLLHTLPYANLNRDDLGSPKSVVYGGKERARVSSQCWKRAVRLEVEQRLADPAVRTRRLTKKIAEDLHAVHQWPQELAGLAGRAVAASAELGIDKAGLTVLVYLPQDSIAELVQVCLGHRDTLEQALTAQDKTSEKQEDGKPKGGKANKRDKALDLAEVLPRKQIVELITSRNSSTALFGRMLAEVPGSKVDGAVQVAHAFTTHATEIEVDFFTAVDDLNPAELTGGGHLSQNEFTTGVFYRYASINLTDLTTNLNGDAAHALSVTEAFLDTFCTAMPQAKKNSTAPFTVPDLAYLAVRADRPVSLAAAFEKPVSPASGTGGFGAPSRQGLATYATQVNTLLGTQTLPFAGHAALQQETLDGLGQRHASFGQLIGAALAAAAPEAR
ncbi:type I-E CRISPR-associated protein Cas7/Cse4/CasC [Crossiella sp. SN42]|uniref:type I-E CRISPR-associated protein Cas7/Cse4/CasC n=1 Tax=Crossiella sp. SN42 TaxID=2944808 RepID=UPI00207D6124|nr:type I-E CRISPR-associated protein Cas7/Cse4/CasC [Crossiella sp. SN42]MCO1575836.1 type I-E CRISPR-associated protein Cas7/Cse4/CasC [Crossiella sp. SN42]